MSDHKNLVGVIYSKQTLAILRIIIDSTNLNIHVNGGEALATAPRSLGHSLTRAFEIVRNKTGREPKFMPLANVSEIVKRAVNAVVVKS